MSFRARRWGLTAPLRRFAGHKCFHLIFQAPHDPPRNTDHQRIRRYFRSFFHNGARPYHAVMSDLSALKDGRVASDKNIISDPGRRFVYPIIPPLTNATAHRCMGQDMHSAADVTALTDIKSSHAVNQTEGSDPCPFPYSWISDDPCVRIVRILWNAVIGSGMKAGQCAAVHTETHLLLFLIDRFAASRTLTT